MNQTQSHLESKIQSSLVKSPGPVYNDAKPRNGDWNGIRGIRWFSALDRRLHVHMAVYDMCDVS